MSSPIAPEQIIVRRNAASPTGWDAFTQEAGASFRCSYRAARAWQLQSHRLFRLRRLELFVVRRGAERKIGQCAVGVGRTTSVFGDGIQLLPAFETHWAMAMSAVLEHLGEASYVYGSEWSLEPPREALLAGVAGVTVDRVDTTSVHVIEFARWATYDDFVRAVSTNVRRNVKKAEKTYPTLRLHIRPGLRGVSGVMKSVSLRQGLFRRKGVERSSVVMGLRSLSRLATLRRYSELAYLKAGDSVLSSYVGVHFGKHYCYMEGASDRDGKGTSWFLLMAMIERAFAESGGKGRFLMGSDDGSQDGVEAWEGLRRSRRQCCATPVATSVVRFKYHSTPEGERATLVAAPHRLSAGAGASLVRRIQMKFGSIVSSFGLAALVVVGGALVGCDNRTPAEKAGDNIKDATHNAADATRDATHDAADATRDAGHKVADKTRDATN